ncbi:hypothetical protein ACSBLW_16610 [Thioclava sp. FR2]|uniref:hypothetical protein n=1 Tax=Thioclava sp. FR2 TaxID=3445780 RepID=UPI003EB7481D
MLRRLTKGILTLALLASGFLTLQAGLTIWANPALRPLRDATTAEITASIDRQLALVATSETLAARIEARLSETPRNWVALDALADLAKDRAIPLPDDLTTQITAAREADFSPAALAGDCADCALDIAKCTLTTAMVCKVPLLLTPLEDIRGIAQAGVDYATGNQIDQIDLGLSIAGLTATGLALTSGGTTLPVKAGATTAKLARGMDLMSPRLIDMAATTARTGIDWAGLPAVRSTDDLAKLLRADAIAPLSNTLTDLGRVTETLGPSATLHLLPLVDDATDAARLSRMSSALGPRTVAAAELLGKSRLFRASLRATNLATELLIGLGALGASLASALASALGGRGLRHIRHRL